MKVSPLSGWLKNEKLIIFNRCGNNMSANLGDVHDMKVVILFFVCICLSLSFLIAVDLLSGLSLSEAIQVLSDSFSTTTLQEYLIIFIFLTFPFITAFITFMRKRKQKS